ncbi:MAG: ATP-binding protein [Gemmatimonadaceae bacterium]
MRRTLVSWSGGKDSALALARLRNDPSIEIVGLLTAVTSEFDRVSTHGTRRSILRAQAESLRLPLFEAAVQVGADNAAYERAWASALDRARTEIDEVNAVAYGDLFLEDVRAYRERQCTQLGVEPLFPLWGEPTSQLAARAIREGYVAYLTCVDTTQLDASFAGRLYDADLLEQLPSSVDPCGERGEFHTCVVDAPIYKEAIAVTRGDRVLRDARFSYSDFEVTSLGRGLT